MSISSLAGKIAPEDILINEDELIKNYYKNKPNIDDPSQQVAFGTSGHRGSSFNSSFTETHILAITQAICEYRKSKSINGPLFMGMDTHALSDPAQKTAIEVLAAHNVQAYIQKDNDYTPTPVVSYAILNYNKDKKSGLADGIVITPSHNPPADGGFKYDPPDAGPADVSITKWIQDRANLIIKEGLKDVRRIPYEKAIKMPDIHQYDFVMPYVNDLNSVVDIDVIRESNILIGADPLGGAVVHYWEPIIEKYKLNIKIIKKEVDKTFKFMTVDHDGKIRMDCSSPYAMASLIKNKDQFDISFGNDTDCDRHGIVTRSSGLMNPNHYLAVSAYYLFQNRAWKDNAGIGKTLVSSSMINKVGNLIKRKVIEVPVGFKWFVDGLLNGNIGFCGEESAGGCFLRKNGTVWVTDKDGVIMDLLACEILAKTGKDPGEHYKYLTSLFGDPAYMRIDCPASREQKMILSKLTPDAVKEETCAGEKITAKLTKAPGNDADIGGLKVETQSGWFAARPSGTEDIYKIYAESFKGREHLEKLVEEAQKIVDSVIKK